MKKLFFLVTAASMIHAANAQLHIQHRAGVHVQPLGFITVQGDLESNDDATGDGVFVMNGHTTQRLHFHGRHAGGLVVENSNNIQLSSPITISRHLVLNAGHLFCNGYQLELTEFATIDGGHAASYIVTSGEGSIKKTLSHHLDNYVLPIGNDNGYAPLSITTSGIYHHAFVEVSSQHNLHPNKPATNDYLRQFWSVYRKGITGTLAIKAKYQHIEGRENDLKGFYWDGLAWNNRQSQVDVRNRTITVPAEEGRGEIYAFNPTTIDRDTRMSVFPNPAQSVATVQVSSSYDTQTDLTVFDVNGRIVLMQKAMLKKGVNRLNINVSGLAKGQYSIKISGENKERAISLIKG